MQYKFQSYMDISTSADTLTMIKVACGGANLLMRTKHLWGAYKYFKIGSVSIKLMPASTLPVDPLGLSYASDDPQTVDPRDQMNPGLVRITNGENVLSDFTGLSDTQIEQIYTNTMLDPRWSKFMLQSGFQRHATPLFWNLGQTAQDVFPGRTVAYPEDGGQGLWSVTKSNLSSTTGEWVSAEGNRGLPLIQTGHRQRVGWLPTDAFFHLTDEQGADGSIIPSFNSVPEIDVITVLLPKAYKTRYYYRMFITETVYFSGLKNTGVGDLAGITISEYRAIDNFMAVPMPTPTMPSVRKGISYPDVNTGGED